MAEHDFCHLVTNLTLKDANTIIEKALAAGRERNLMPLTVAVLDSGGHLIAMQREDGSGILRCDVAFGKAWGALGMGQSSRTLRNRLKDVQAFQGALATASSGRFIPVPGGVVVLNSQGHGIGAVGISGDVSDQDEYCAIVGIKAAGLTPMPADPAV